MPRRRRRSCCRSVDVVCVAARLSKVPPEGQESVFDWRVGSCTAECRSHTLAAVYRVRTRRVGGGRRVWQIVEAVQSSLDVVATQDLTHVIHAQTALYRRLSGATVKKTDRNATAAVETACTTGGVLQNDAWMQTTAQLTRVVGLTEQFITVGTSLHLFQMPRYQFVRVLTQLWIVCISQCHFVAIGTPSVLLEFFSFSIARLASVISFIDNGIKLCNKFLFLSRGERSGQSRSLHDIYSYSVNHPFWRKWYSFPPRKG